jgi:hypothetical protein
MSMDSPTCIECGRHTDKATGEAIYPHRPDLRNKRFWLCRCGAYVGCHSSTWRPLGYPCGPETRKARMAAHDAFDHLWRGGPMSRGDAYAWLGEVMRLPPEECHIGMMSEAQAREAARLSVLKLFEKEGCN